MFYTCAPHYPINARLIFAKKFSIFRCASHYGIHLISANWLQYTHTHTPVRMIQLREKHIPFNYLIKVFTTWAKQLLNCALCNCYTLPSSRSRSRPGHELRGCGHSYIVMTSLANLHLGILASPKSGRYNVAVWCHDRPTLTLPSPLPPTIH